MPDSTLTPSRLKPSWLIGVAGAFVIFAAVAAYSKRMTDDYTSYDQQRSQDRYATLAKVREAENAMLEPTDPSGKPTAAWADQDKGLIKIPIEEAMTHAVDDLQKKTPGPGAVIPGTTPPPPPAPAPAPVPPAAPAATAAAPAPAASAAPANAAKTHTHSHAEKKKPAAPASAAAANPGNP
ncbi:MAG: hypothetical protein WDO13_14335 [Verrucomicrobiota bacterium]